MQFQYSTPTSSISCRYIANSHKDKNGNLIKDPSGATVSKAETMIPSGNSQFYFTFYPAPTWNTGDVSVGGVVPAGVRLRSTDTMES